MSLDIECPHCGHESLQHFEFNMEAGDRSGVDSGLQEVDCWECDKKFYFKAFCAFELELTDIFKKKPKGIK